MAGPMRDTPPTNNPPTTANFEYDDNEWDIGIGDLIIDLDADIEKTGVGEGMATPKPGKMHSPVEHQATVDKGLKMKIKRTKPGTKHEIVKSGENGEKHPKRGGSSSHRREKKHSDKSGITVGGSSGTSANASSGGSSASGTSASPAAAPPTTSNMSQNGVLRAYPALNIPTGASPVAVKRPPDEQPSPNLKKIKGATMEPAKVVVPGAALTDSLMDCENMSVVRMVEQPAAAPPVEAKVVSLPPAPPSPSTPPPLIPQLPTPPPNHFHNEVPNTSETKESVDVCIGTSVGTITEPDCLGPCEPGTSVTLEGIVWHETEGVLVVNVTWRGKTYVGTLLDCSKHDWAPPRFCESPISDLDARTPKGRGKRGRSTTNSLGDLSNFTETRSSMHSKLRSNFAGAKGRKGPSSSSPTPFSIPKTEVPSSKRKTKPPEEEVAPKRKVAPPPPVTVPLAAPVLLECPEPNCSKKYKHINGLKYHQSHAHGSPEDEEAKESGVSDEEYTAVQPEIKKEEPPAPCLRAPSVCEEPLPESEPSPSKPLNFSTDETTSVIQPSFPLPILVNSTATPEEPPPLPPSAAVDQQQQQQQPPPPQQATNAVKKLPQFKVKPASELMPEEKKLAPSPPLPAAPTTPKPNQNKKKAKKSPDGSPQQSHSEPPSLGIEVERENVQSPAYSDISDDGAPVLESEVDGKPKRIVSDKKEAGHSPQLQSFGMYPYYGNPPYLVPSVSDKPKEPSAEKVEQKPPDKDKKEGTNEFQQKYMSQHYYQYGYHVPSGFNYVDGFQSVVVDDKKDESIKSSPTVEMKRQSPTTQLRIPSPNTNLSKPKVSVGVSKEKQQSENHQILKESIEIKSQMSPTFMYPRQQPSQSQEDVRRFYVYPERKDGNSTKATPPPHKSVALHSPKPKEKSEEKKDRREEEKKQQEGVKPTMETQGPPPPPTSQYTTYIHPGFLQSYPHLPGPLPIDPNHPMYRGVHPLLASGFPNAPYLHHQLHAVPRYHAPEDLSRPQSGKALDLLQHHASQYYTHPTHKIHELQERAIKSPIPKTSPASSSPSAVGPVTSVTNTASSQGSSKVLPPENKDTRSPPPQRHVHTHHHTHVGLGYPILAGQYPAPYGAAVLASEHAAAVSSVQYQPK